MTSQIATAKKVTAVTVREAKGQVPLVAITAYDYTMARLVDEQVDIVLVGDSLGMVVQGNPHTLSVTVDEMIYHCRAVARAVRHSHLVVDMPFMSYQVSVEEALRNAGKILAEGGAEAVKLEGGVAMAPTVERLVAAGIPVMGHLGLMPQSVHTMGGYRVQGKTDKAKESLLEDAVALEDAGAYAIVLEGIPAELAKNISERLKIPTIGIGAGADCDGQILVGQDLLGLNVDFKPRFVKHFAHLGEDVRRAVAQYAEEVKNRNFPTKEHSF